MLGLVQSTRSGLRTIRFRQKGKNEEGDIVRLINDNADTLKELLCPPLGVLCDAKPLTLDLLVVDRVDDTNITQLEAVSIPLERCWKQPLTSAASSHREGDRVPQRGALRKCVPRGAGHRDAALHLLAVRGEALSRRRH